jgi:hypothetical protein
MFCQKSRFKDFYHKSLSEEYDVATSTNYKTKDFLEPQRSTLDPYPWKNRDIVPLNISGYERSQDTRPFVKNPVKPTIDMYDDKVGIFKSKIEFGRGVYPVDTFTPRPKTKINM